MANDVSDKNEDTTLDLTNLEAGNESKLLEEALDKVKEVAIAGEQVIENKVEQIQQDVKKEEDTLLKDDTNTTDVLELSGGIVIKEKPKKPIRKDLILIAAGGIVCLLIIIVLVLNAQYIISYLKDTSLKIKSMIPKKDKPEKSSNEEIGTLENTPIYKVTITETVNNDNVSKQLSNYSESSYINDIEKDLLKANVSNIDKELKEIKLEVINKIEESTTPTFPED